MGTLTRLTPEGFDIANAYVQYGSVKQVAYELDVPEYEVVKTLQTPEIKRYLDGVYLDMGYRNRDKLGAVLDKMIDAKIEEAEESGVYSSKDLADLLLMAHKMRMDEIKATKEVAGGTSVQIANFGGSGYQEVMGKLLGGNNNGN